MTKLRNFKDVLLEDLKDPDYARVYLSVALEEYEHSKDASSFFTALRDLVKANGGLAQLASKTKLNRQNLYRALSAKGNPRFETIETVLHEYGYRLTVVPVAENNIYKNNKI